MKLFAKLSLALLMSLAFNQMSLAERWESVEQEDGEEFFEDGTATRGCKRVKCLVVCGNASVGGTLSVSGNETVGGSLSVGGTVTGSAFAVSPAPAVGTPGVPGIGGMLAWGEVSNLAGGVAVVAGAVPMNTASASFSGVVEGTGLPATSGLTLTNAGIYIFYYSVSYTADASTTTTVTINLTSSLGTNPIPNSQYTTSNVNPASTSQVVQSSGFVIASMPAGAFVQLNTTTGFTTNTLGNVGAKLMAIRIA